MPSIPTQETVMLDLIALIVVGFLAFRQFREKQARVGRLWVLPALALMFSYTSIEHDLFDTRWSPAIIAVGFVVGLLVGGMGAAATTAGLATGLVTATLLSFSLGAIIATRVY